MPLEMEAILDAVTMTGEGGKDTNRDKNDGSCAITPTRDEKPG